MHRKVNLQVSQAQLTSEEERIEDQGIFKKLGSDKKIGRFTEPDTTRRGGLACHSEGLDYRHR